MGKIQLKRGDSSSLGNITLAAGEPAFTLNDGKLYVGDGTNKVLINHGIGATLNVQGRDVNVPTAWINTAATATQVDANDGSLASGYYRIGASPYGSYNLGDLIFHSISTSAHGAITKEAVQIKYSVTTGKTAYRSWYLTGADTSATWSVWNEFGTNMQYKIDALGLLKGDEYNGIVAAVPGTDYVTPNTAIAPSKKCKITYDAKGLITAGENLAITDIQGLFGDMFDLDIVNGKLRFPTTIQNASGAVLDAYPAPNGWRIVSSSATPYSQGDLFLTLMDSSTDSGGIQFRWHKDTGALSYRWSSDSASWTSWFMLGGNAQPKILVQGILRGDGAGGITAAAGNELPSHTHLSTQISGLGTAATCNTGTSSGRVPVLDESGKLPISTIPALAISDTFVVTDETAMTTGTGAGSAEAAEVGDVCICSASKKTYILKTAGRGTLANWAEILTPANGVTSISAGAGMNFSTITSSGSVTMGTPSTITAATTNSASGTTHSHALTLPSVGGATAGIAPAPGAAPATKQFLAAAITSGTVAWGTIAAGDVPTLNQNTTGTAANVTGTVAIANGGTGATAKAAAFNALQPMTAAGDIIYGGTSGAATVLAKGTDGQVLKLVSGAPAWTAIGGGDVTGPATAVDNAIVRFDSTTGKLLQNSTVTIDDTGSVNIPSGQSYKINGIALAASNVGLGNVTNESKATMFTSAALTGAPTAPTPTISDDSTKIATTAFVKAQGYAPAASPALTGTPTAPTAAVGTNTTQVATTAYVLAATIDGGTF